ncbi:hypothetical protein BDZ91DRAFT_194001 [Kalaharituber pfeilii]|nr:hypothetical protein BDZ91DRAFT_194001 [Kalaharituber pfeilii]
MERPDLIVPYLQILRLLCTLWLAVVASTSPGTMKVDFGIADAQAKINIRRSGEMYAAGISLANAEAITSSVEFCSGTLFP